MAASESSTDESLYPIAVLIDELKNEDVQVCTFPFHRAYLYSACRFLKNHLGKQMMVAS